MDLAAQETVRRTLVAHGRLLGQHDQLCSSAAPQESHVPIPERYSSEAATCASVLLQCSLVFDLQPLTYASNRATIAFVVNLLSGRAVQWATAVLENHTPASSSFPAFTAKLKWVCDHQVLSGDSASQILSLHHGSSSIADNSTHSGNAGWRQRSACIVARLATSSPIARPGPKD